MPAAEQKKNWPEEQPFHENGEPKQHSHCKVLAIGQAMPDNACCRAKEELARRTTLP